MEKVEVVKVMGKGVGLMEVVKEEVGRKLFGTEVRFGD